MKTLVSLLLLFVPVLAPSCGQDATEATDAVATPSQVPERFWLESPPPDTQDVGAARVALEDGAKVSVRGVVGGSRKPFVDGLAAFMLVDPALKSCVGDGMNCPTPWDYCCEDPQVMAQNTVTVELREGDRILAANLEGLQGLEHLATVVVQGVAETDPRGNVTVVASGVYPED